MKTPDQHRLAVETIVPDLYAEVAQSHGGFNMAGSNRCDLLTKNLYDALTSQDFEVRREFHKQGEPWHYVIAHTPLQGEPTDEDIITDLNPWQYLGTQIPLTKTYLHGARGEIMEILRKEAIPEHLVALRGLATIRRAHTLASNDYKDF